MRVIDVNPDMASEVEVQDQAEFPPSDGPACESCRFWAAKGGYYQTGLCRRQSPQVFVTVPHIGDVGRHRRDSESAWPTTRPDDWCGEYQPDIQGPSPGPTPADESDDSNPLIEDIGQRAIERLREFADAHAANSDPADPSPLVRPVLTVLLGTLRRVGLPDVSEAAERLLGLRVD